MPDLCQNTVSDIETKGLDMLAEMAVDPMLALQFELEEGMKTEGAERYRKINEQHEKRGTEGDMLPVKDLVRENVLRVSDGLAGWMKAEDDRIAARRAAGGKGGFKKKLPYNWLSEIGPVHAAYIGLKTIFNSSGRVRGTSIVAQAIGRAIEEEINVRRFADKAPRLYAKIVEDFDSRSSVHHRRVLRSAIQRHYPELLDFDGAQASVNAQVATGLVVIEQIIVTTGLFKTEMVSSRTKHQETLEMTEKTLEYIRQRHVVAQFFLPNYKPCVIPPRPWTDVRSGGYHGVLAGRHCVVKGRHGDRAYIRKLREADMSLVYEGLNYLQNTAWAVNKDVFAVMDEYVGRSTLAGLPDVAKRDPLDRLSFFDQDSKTWTEEQKKRLRDWRRKNAEIHSDNWEKEGQITTLASSMETARAYIQYDRFYFPWNLDTRGRCYPIARGLQPQGADWQKSLLRFADGQPYTAEARYWLMFHGANCYGETDKGKKLDKALYRERVQWVEDNKELIFSVADDPHGTTDIWADENRESPWMFLAFCFEFTRCERQAAAGLPAMTHLAPAFDGSCNGLQHFSAALRDKVGGKAVNLTANDEPSDIYSLVMEKLVVRLEAFARRPEEEVIWTEEVDEDTGEVYQKGKLSDHAQAMRWLKSKQINRDLCKQPVMTTPYGSNTQGIKGQMIKKLDGRGFHFPRLSFREYEADEQSDNFAECQWLAVQIGAAIADVVVKAREAMDWLQSTSTLTNKLGRGIEWVAPSGLPIKQYYEDLSILRIETEFMGNGRYVPQLHDVTKPGKLSKHEQKNGIAPNFVHSLDASALILTVVALGRKGVRDFFMIHDSFAVPAFYSMDLWIETRRVFVDMYEKHDVLAEYLEHLKAQLPEEMHADIKPLPKKGNLDLSEVLRSDFFFA